MAPGRRSQGPPPPPQATPPRASKRPRVPSARATANAASGRGRGRGCAAGGRRPSTEPVIDESEGGAEEDSIPDPPLPRMPIPPPLPPMPTVLARHVGSTASLKKKKDQLRQMEDRRTGKTKPYAILKALDSH